MVLAVGRTYVYGFSEALYSLLAVSLFEIDLTEALICRIVFRIDLDRFFIIGNGSSPNSFNL